MVRVRRYVAPFGNKKGKYRGIAYDSKLERKFLDLCYRFGVKAERSTLRIPYKDDDGKSRVYLPDFYLPDFNHTVEIKGFWALASDHAWVAAKSGAAMKQLGQDNYTVLTEQDIKGNKATEFFRRLHEKANTR